MVRLSQHAHQVASDCRCFRTAEERVGGALAIASRRATDAMHIVLDVCWEVEVYNVTNVANVWKKKKTIMDPTCKCQSIGL